MLLRDYLTQSGLTQAQFGRLIGTENRVTVARYVNGTRIPRPAEMARITAATDGQVTANDFYAAYVSADGEEDAA